MAPARRPAPPDPPAPPAGTPDPLSAYRAKRDFGKTAEPAAGGAAGRGVFVVQHHWARREHYDFRLELDGVLVSFAVAKGPSLVAGMRRLAVRTEDHPLSYADFEGVIPRGEYGGGTVMVWDRGLWMPVSGDPQAALRDGELKFVLLGERMKGGYVLVRMNVEKGRENWLLIKEKDDYAEREDAGYPARFDASVASGRSRAAIEREEAPHSFARDRAAAQAAAAGEDPPPARRPVPAFVPPALCESRDAAPAGDDWLNEIKYDGYRIEAAVSGDDVRLHSREGLDWTHRFPVLAEALAGLGLDGVLLDGEAVVFDARGLSSFPALVDALDSRSAAIAYVAFDLLAAAGEDLTGLPLATRKARLSAVLAGADGRILRLAAALRGDGPAVFAEAVKGGAEGIVAKRADAPYRSGRQPTWVKVKADTREDVVVVGYMPSDKRPFRSLHCAVEENGRLRYVGGVGTGFDAAALVAARARLDPDRRDGPAPGIEHTQAAPKGLVWVDPKYRIEVRIGGWTGDGNLRQARFLGWREDRAPRPAAARAAPAGAPPAAARPARPPRTASPARAADPAPDPAAALARISHADRILFPEAGVTKGDVARHYLAVADRILPHLAGRPVSFLRAPEGLSGETFFQRHILPGMKRGVFPIEDPQKRHQAYLGIDGVDGLVTAAQFGVIELHGWMARLPDLAAPDRMVFDFDPDEGVGFDAVKEAAFAVRAVLETVGLASFCMASGGKGLHVVVPLDGTQDFDAIGDFSGGLARGLAKAEPKRYVAVASKERRHGRIFVDWLRNRPYATAVLPWSLRARPGASVAVPLAWDEVADLAAASAFGLAEAAARDDPWRDFWTLRQSIAPAAIAHLRRTAGR